MIFEFFFANVREDSDGVRSSTGRLFHVAGPDTAKSRRPIVVLVHVLVRGTTSVPLSADRNCHLPTTDETGMHSAHVSQVRRCQTTKALEGNDSQLESEIRFVADYGIWPNIMYEKLTKCPK